MANGRICGFSKKNGRPCKREERLRRTKTEIRRAFAGVEGTVEAVALAKLFKKGPVQLFVEWTNGKVCAVGSVLLNFSLPGRPAGVHGFVMNVAHWFFRMAT